jgi:hypothetical protein
LKYSKCRERIKGSEFRILDTSADPWTAASSKELIQ